MLCNKIICSVLHYIEPDKFQVFVTELVFQRGIEKRQYDVLRSKIFLEVAHALVDERSNHR